MFIHNEIRKNLSLFSDICKNHGIKSLYAFGSSVTEQFNPQRSDIDLFVKTDDFFLLSGRLMMFHTKIIRNDSNEFGICRLSGSRIDTVTK